MRTGSAGKGFVKGDGKKFVVKENKQYKDYAAQYDSCLLYTSRSTGQLAPCVINIKDELFIANRIDLSADFLGNSNGSGFFFCLQVDDAQAGNGGPAARSDQPYTNVDRRVAGCTDADLSLIHILHTCQPRDKIEGKPNGKEL